MVRRWVPALVLGGVWWWAVLRLALEPAHAGLVEGAVAAGGWGLSLLPVHVAATAGTAGAGRKDAGAGGAWRSVLGVRWADRRFAVGERCAERVRGVARVTRAWLRRRSGGGSGRS
ncbi:hypothetical protein [Streptomyces sp. NBC_00893]|uniref:hypothetical protein n=1 Tax=Streptomyces sp. NBC_00893 TaxID=2975862 RepID=UPI00225AC2E0|nr:hypothetical protein [Streptomyces sp. NBC_00893]MCX4844770.1 hypothetical protein [Streptomyces sp. NBC_00893]